MMSGIMSTDGYKDFMLGRSLVKRAAWAEDLQSGVPDGD